MITDYQVAATIDGWLLGLRPPDDELHQVDTTDVDSLIKFCAESLSSAYAQEALVRQFVEDVGRFEGRLVTDGEWRKIRGNHIGLDTEGGLYAAWFAAAKRAQWEWANSQVSDGARLMLWGSPHANEKQFYSDLAKVARWQPPELQEVYRRFDHFTVMEDWVLANGVLHLTRREATSALIERVRDQELSNHPLPAYEPLDLSMGAWALELAGTVYSEELVQKRLALCMFSALSRIAAYEQFGGWVRWRSEWLRGARADERAIPGASTYSKELTTLLHEHVIEQVKGHWAGGNGQPARAATYRLRRQILRGPWTRVMFARQVLGVELNRRGIPR